MHEIDMGVDSDVIIIVKRKQLQFARNLTTLVRKLKSNNNNKTNCLHKSNYQYKINSKRVCLKLGAPQRLHVCSLCFFLMVFLSH